MLRRHAATVVAVVSALVFVAMTVLASAGISHVDHSVLAWTRRDAVGWLQTVADRTTDVLSPPVDAAVLAVVAAVVARRERRSAPVAVAAVVGAVTSAVVIGVKHAVGRPPPYPPGLTSGASFPSGHTAATLVFLATAVLVATRPGGRRRLLLAAVGVLTLGCAAALVYDGYHWLTDCVASVALGVAIVGVLLRRQPA